MHTLNGMKKEGLRSRAGKGGYNLPPDESGFTDSRHDNTSFRFKDEIHSLRKAVIEFVDEVQDAFSLDLEDVFSHGDRFVFLHYLLPLH
jgi:hypothetical protein